MEKYVVVTNSTDVQLGFTDHRGSMRMLKPRGNSEDSVKLCFSEAQEPRAMRVYQAMQGSPGLRVVFSKDCVQQIKSSKQTVVSNKNISEDVQRRVSALRAQTTEQLRTDNLQEARMQRARLMSAAAIKTNTANPVLPENQDSKPTAPAQKPQQKPAAPLPKPVATATPDKTTVMTEDELKAMHKSYLLDIAKGLGIAVDQGMEKPNLIKMILEHK